MRIKKVVSRRSIPKVQPPNHPRTTEYRSNLLAFFRKYKALKDKISTKAAQATQRTPFKHLYNAFRDGLVLEDDYVKKETLIVDIIRRYNPETKAFRIGNKDLKLKTSDVERLFGLPNGNKEMLMRRQQKSGKDDRFWNKWFPNMVKMRKAAIEKAMDIAVTLDSDEGAEDFARLVVLHFSATVLFANQDTSIGMYMLKFVRSLEGVSKYNWAETVRAKLLESIDANHTEESVAKVTGCVILLPYWLAEHTTLISPITINQRPDFLRWNMRKLNSKLRTNPLETLPPKKVHKWAYSARNPFAEEGDKQIVATSTEYESRTDHVEDMDDSNEVGILRKKLKTQEKELKKASLAKLNYERRIDRLQGEKSALESDVLNIRKEMEEMHSTYALENGKLQTLLKENQDTIDQLLAQLNKSSPPNVIPDDVLVSPNDNPEDFPEEVAATTPAADKDDSSDESTESDDFAIVKRKQTPEQQAKIKGKAPATIASFINRIKTRKRKPHVIPDCVDIPMKKKKIICPSKVHRTKPPSERYPGTKKVVYKHLRESDKKMLDQLHEQYEEGCVWGNTPSLCVFMEDVTQLIGNKSISNLVINAFANILQRRMDASREKYKDSYFFDCFAFPAARAQNVTSMQTHIFGRMKESSDYRYNFFPINSSVSKDSTEGYHWTLLKVDTDEGLWTLYNSLHGNRKRQQQYRADALLMKKTFEDHMNEILPLVTPSVQTRLVLDDKCPQQYPDTLDCGPFVCYYMQELSAGRPLPEKLPRDAIKRFRAEMASCILNDPGFTRQLMPTNSGLL